MEQDLRRIVSELQQKLSSEERELKQKKDVFLEKISFFSELSVQTTQQKREYRRYEQELVKINEDIQKIDISGQDLDSEIAFLESQLLEESNQEKKLKTELHQTINKRSKYIQKMTNGFQSKFLEELNLEKQKDKEYLYQLQKVQSEINENILSTEEEHACLNNDLINQEKEFNQLISVLTTHEGSIKDAYLMAMLASFNQLDKNELEYIEKHALDIDLYYAMHVRLAFLAYKDKNYLISFKHLSYLTDKYLNWYDLCEFFNDLKSILIDLHPGILSQQRFLNLAKETSDLNQMEAYINLSLHIEQGGDLKKAYLILLGLYLDIEAWIRVDEIYLKLQKFKIWSGFEDEKTLNISQKMQSKMQECYASYSQLKTPSSLLKLQQLCSTNFFREYSTNITNGLVSYRMTDIHQLILAHLETTDRDRLISSLNSKEFFETGIHLSNSVFLNAWYQYALAIHLNKMKKNQEAQLKLDLALGLSPYFQEARVFYEKLSPQFSWVSFFLDNKKEKNKSLSLESPKQVGSL